MALPISIIPHCMTTHHLSSKTRLVDNARSPCGKEKLSNEEFMSWVAFHCLLHRSPVQEVELVALLRLFLENSHTSAMIRHGMYVVNDVVQYVNPGQTSVIAMDQPLFALAKLIQWNMLETHCEGRIQCHVWGSAHRDGGI